MIFFDGREIIENFGGLEESKMDKNQKDGFCVMTLDALDMFYSDPANLKQFMEVEKEYDRRVEVAI